MVVRLDRSEFPPGVFIGVELIGQYSVGLINKVGFDHIGFLPRKYMWFLQGTEKNIVGIKGKFL